MKRLVLSLGVVGLLSVAVAFSRQNPAVAPVVDPVELQVAKEERNPWTHLKVNDEAEQFQFVVVSDRTGGHREKIFSRAVEQINLLQPEFVISVGDLIEGYTTNQDRINDQWKEFQNFTARLQMPFFYVPGNHDLTNDEMVKTWQAKFGRRYYHFVYRNVLFLMLCSEDPPGTNSLSAEQVEYVKKALADNPNVRWTVVALHKPIWTAPNLEKNGWLEVEKSLAGRPYTVFAGHVHRYQKFVRNGMNYYQLATTGGGSRLRGVKFGEFDHIAWVTMKKDGPVIANVMLDGIYPENLKVPDTVEPGLIGSSERKATHPAKGLVYVDGVPAAGATVVFHLKVPDTKRLTRAGDALVEGDGSFVLGTYRADDGVPAGEYVVTIHDELIKVSDGVPPRKGQVPERYSKVETSELTAVVKSGANEFLFDLKR